MVTILGAGVAGASLAWALARRGRRDVVVFRNHTIGWVTGCRLRWRRGFISGNYEMTFDHHPLVGETARGGVWSSCGFSGHGVMQSPAVADNLAAMINGDSPPLDIRSLSPQRTEPLIDLTQL
jgi:glycine/D-amino acid oxidase-like deaminating enzyme